MKVIEFQNVFRSYGDMPVLSALSFALSEGECLALVGPSGIGKTTLLRLAAGLDQPDEGRILLRELVAFDGKQRMAPEERDIGMVFQDFVLWPHMNVTQHLEFVLKQKGLSKSARRDRIGELLEIFEMQDYCRAKPGRLSGGQQQRLSLMRALAPSPSILLLDEPLSNLDKQLREKCLNYFQNLKRKGVTMIYATHEEGEVEGIADDTLLLPRH